MTPRRLLWLAAIVAAGCSNESSNESTPSTNPWAEEIAAAKASSDAQIAKLPNNKPDFTFTAPEWHAEVKKDEAAAKAKYTDKVIELTGTVETTIDQAEPLALSLVHLAVPNDLIGVRCDCPAGAWKLAVPKAAVTVRGVYGPNTFLTGELFPCVVVRSDANPVTLRMADVVKEVEADPDAAGDKYDDFWCYVEGTVKSFGKNKSGFDVLRLAGPEGITIEMFVPADDRARFETLTPSTPVKLFGQLNVYTFADKAISMSFTRLVD